ncbi:MAG: lactate racemase domain-containing protein [Lutisporaceae bacterium]|jgi:hypothetical protein
MSGVTNLVSHIKLPRFVRAHQYFPHTELSPEQVKSALDEAFARPEISDRIQPGKRICITAGSRGVSNMTLVTKYLVDYIKARGAYPFLIPAMGSHGGATAEGQHAILESLGITEHSMGCPIVSSMETVEISRIDGLPVNIDKNAYEADGIIVLNRVKAHTSFQGLYESGLMKMMTIGLGKQHGAYTCHSKGDDFMSQRISLIGSEIIKCANVLLGVALLENAYERTYRVEVLPAENIPQEEPKLLAEAKKAMGRIWFDTCDVLIVKQLGKNFSGAGMDPNVTGRCVNPKLRMGIEAQRIGVLDISEESHGNATGMGRADLAPRRFFNKISFDDTYPNFVTSYSPSAFMMPIIVDNDEEVFKTAVASSINIDYENPRIIVINNSLEIEDILISEVMIREAEDIPWITVEGAPFFLDFDTEGNLITMF